MKGWVTGIIIVVVAAAAFTAGWFAKPAQEVVKPVQLKDVTFAVNWVFDGEHVPFFVALDKGWYREQGLNVKILRGFGGSDTVKRVAAGEVPIGMGDAVSAILARSKGLNVKIIGIVFDRAPFAFHALKESGIDHPSKLAGKTAASPPGDVQRAAWPLLAKAVGIDPNSLKWVNVDPAAKIASLCEKKVDAVPFFYDAVQAVWKACGGRDKVITMPYWKYGVNIYGMVLVTREDVIEKDPDMIKGFLEATYKAIQWSINNPEEAVDIMLQYQPQLDREFILNQWYIEISTMQTDRIKNNYLGYIDRTQMQNTIDATVEGYGITPPSVDEVFTNEFLPRYELPDVSYPIPEFLKP
jgi:NitT/TauT family transport system substrate-binding protein